MNSLTLEAVRTISGHTLEDAASLCSVPVEQMKAYEEDPGKLPARATMKLRWLYGVPIDYIKI